MSQKNPMKKHVNGFEINLWNNEVTDILFGKKIEEL